MRYFQEKQGQGYRQVGEHTPSVLAECLDVTDDKGNIIQESGWLEIDEATFDNLENGTIKWDISKQKFVDVAPPSKAEINAPKISELKQKLTDSDYKLFKYMEGQLTNEEYIPIAKQRQEWRDEINRLENER